MFVENLLASVANPVVSDDCMSAFEMVWKASDREPDGHVFSVSLLLTDRVTLIVTFVWKARASRLRIIAGV